MIYSKNPWFLVECMPPLLNALIGLHNANFHSSFLSSHTAPSFTFYVNVPVSNEIMSVSHLEKSAFHFSKFLI